MHVWFYLFFFYCTFWLPFCLNKSMADWDGKHIASILLDRTATRYSLLLCGSFSYAYLRFTLHAVVLHLSLPFWFMPHCPSVHLRFVHTYYYTCAFYLPQLPAGPLLGPARTCRCLPCRRACSALLGSAFSTRRVRLTWLYRAPLRVPGIVMDYRTLRGHAHAGIVWAVGRTDGRTLMVVCCRRSCSPPRSSARRAIPATRAPYCRAAAFTPSPLARSRPVPPRVLPYTITLPPSAVYHCLWPTRLPRTGFAPSLLHTPLRCILPFAPLPFLPLRGTTAFRALLLLQFSGPARRAPLLYPPCDPTVPRSTPPLPCLHHRYCVTRLDWSCYFYLGQAWAWWRGGWWARCARAHCRVPYGIALLPFPTFSLTLTSAAAAGRATDELKTSVRRASLSPTVPCLTILCCSMLFHFCRPGMLPARPCTTPNLPPRVFSAYAACRHTRLCLLRLPLPRLPLFIFYCCGSLQGLPALHCSVLPLSLSLYHAPLPSGADSSGSRVSPLLLPFCGGGSIGRSGESPSSPHLTDCTFFPATYCYRRVWPATSRCCVYRILWFFYTAPCYRAHLHRALLLPAHYRWCGSYYYSTPTLSSLLFYLGSFNLYTFRCIYTFTSAHM